MKFFLFFSALMSVSCSHLFVSQDIKKDIAKINRKSYLGKAKPIRNQDYLKKWHLEVTDAKKAWLLSQGDKNIVVAIIDTGIDTRHKDLQENLWVNKKEQNGKPGKDDDNNGFVDDIYGWNFVHNNNNVMDKHGHGTHVAGIIGGKGKVCNPGIAPQVSLMALKYYHPNNSGNQNLNNTIKAIHYAIQNGANIINFSGGGSSPNEREMEAILLALEKNILFVTAGGNEHANIEDSPYYPASYNLPNIFSVGSTNPSDEHSTFSNKGSLITAHAPGSNIYSTLPNNQCGFQTGTSQSTPIFTGGAVLVKANKKLTQVRDIIKHLKQTTDRRNQLSGKSETGGRSNIYKAVGSNESRVVPTGDSIQFSEEQSFTLPGNDENSSKPKSDISLLTDLMAASSKTITKRTPSSKPKSHQLASPSIWATMFLDQMEVPFTESLENLDSLNLSP